MHLPFAKRAIDAEVKRLHDEICSYDEQIGEAYNLELAIGSMEPARPETVHLVMHYRMRADELRNLRRQAQDHHRKVKKIQDGFSDDSPLRDPEQYETAASAPRT